MNALDTALRLARMGWRIVPELWREEPQRTVPPLKGWNEAACTDEATIREWWGKWPGACIGAIPPHDVVVVDVDFHGADGFATLRALEKERGALQRAWEASTPRNGRHIILRLREGWECANATHWREGIDLLRGKVSLPPAPAREGRLARSWCGTGDFMASPPPFFPEGWREILPARRKPEPVQAPQIAALARSSGQALAYGRAALENAVQRIQRAPDGQGVQVANTEAYSIGRIAHECGIEAESEPALLGAIAGWSFRERGDKRMVEHNIRKGLRDGAANPKPIPQREIVHKPAPHGLRVVHPQSQGEAQKPARPQIEEAANAAQTVDEIVSILGEQDELLFQRGRHLARIQLPTQDEPACTRDLCVDQLRVHATRHADFYKITADGMAPCRPREETLRSVLALRDYPKIRELDFVTESPILKPNGEVFTGVGYEAMTRGYRVGPVWSARILADDEIDKSAALDAINRIADLFKEFPFDKNTFDTQLTAVLCAGLTIALRPLIDGPVPLFLATASSAGSGKTLAMQAVSVLATGYEAATAQVSGDPEEDRKMILSHARKADPVVLLDNLPIGGFGNQHWDAAFTSKIIEGRLLGSTEIVRYPMRTVWLATGNNVRLNGDTARRTITIRMVPDMERPETRAMGTYQHPHLIAHIRANRQALYNDLMTIWRCYHKEGKPHVNTVSTGSFTSWEQNVRDPLVWAGMATVGTANESEGANEEVLTLARFLHAWFERYRDDPQTSSSLVGALNDGKPHRQPHPSAEFGEALLFFCPALAKKSTPDTIGRILSRYDGRVVNREGSGRLQLVKLKPTRQGAQMWAVMEIA